MKNIILKLLVSISILMAAAPTRSLAMSSAGYSLTPDVVASGGNAAGSTGYTLDGTLGESFVGSASSPGGSLYAGFWRMLNNHPIAAAQTVSTLEDIETVITLSGEDIDNDLLSYNIAALPANGTLYQTSDGITRGDAITLVPTKVADASHRVIYVPALNGNGTGHGNFSFNAYDGQDNSSEAVVTIDVTPVNDGPTISNMANQNIDNNTTLGPIAFTVNDIDNASLIVTATSSNKTLVPDANITLDGSGDSRTITVTPAVNLNGVTTITLTVSDGSLTASDQFVLAVKDTIIPAISSVSIASGSYINTVTIGYNLSEAVTSGSITFTRTGGSADSATHTYNLVSSDMSAGSHSINTGLSLVNGAVYDLSLTVTDAGGNASATVTNTNVTYGTDQAVATITAPPASGIVNNASVGYTLSEDVSAGDIIFTRTGGTEDGMSPHTYIMGASDKTSGSHTVNTNKPLMSGGVYTVSIQNVTDKAGNPTAIVSNTNVTYDATSVAITNVSPAANSIITSSGASYTLSEQAQSGKVTFTRSGGAADGTSPHVYTMTASDLTAGAHTVTTNLNLVDGATYTVTFEATDLIGNPATTISNATVYYESTHSAIPIGNVDNAGYSIDRVDGYDLIKLSVAFGSQSGNVNWNPVCDLTMDGKVDGNDLMTLGAHFGEVQ